MKYILNKIRRINNTVYLLLNILLFFVMTSCKNEQEKTNEILNVDTIEEKTLSDSIQIDILTETRHAYVKEVIRNNTGIYIKVDYVDYLTGEEAIKAEKRDKAYFIDGEDTISNITGGYYISNQNNKLRTFFLTEDAQINIFYIPKDAYEFEKVEGASITQFLEHIDREPLLLLKINKGIIKSIEEQFIP